MDAVQHGDDVSQQKQVLAGQLVEQPEMEIPNGEKKNESARPETVARKASRAAGMLASPLDRMHLLVLCLSFHRVHPLVVQIDAQHAAGDVSQEVLVVKIKTLAGARLNHYFSLSVIL